MHMLQRLLDPYERKARLTPSLLTICPVLGVLFGLHGLKQELSAALVGFLSTFGVLYVFASIARELGKRLENRLFDSWGGKPTTILLRHRDSTLDPVTKARYHAFLSRRIGVSFPTAEQEQVDALSADDRYAAGAKWLLDQTRDTRKFALLFKENISYGFRRNCLGLKPYALLIAAGSLVWVLVALGAVTSNGFYPDVLRHASTGAWVAIGGSSFAILVWLSFFTKKTVRTAAFSYADFLLRSCDSLQ
jgi:hypothetical protein